MRLVHIADIENTTVSSGTMFCPPIMRFDSQLFPGHHVVAPSGPDFWTSAAPRHMNVASVPYLRAAAVQKNSRDDR